MYTRLIYLTYIFALIIYWFLLLIPSYIWLISVLKLLNAGVYSLNLIRNQIFICWLPCYLMKKFFPGNMSLASLLLIISLDLPHPHCTVWGPSFSVTSPLVCEHFHTWRGAWLRNLGLRKKGYMYNQFCSILLTASKSQGVS